MSARFSPKPERRQNSPNLWAKLLSKFGMIFLASVSVRYKIRSLDAWLLITSGATVTVSIIAALSGVGMAACLVILILAPTVTVIGYELLGYPHTAEALSD
jgi:hypothetical protein